MKLAGVLKHPWSTKHEPVSIMFDKRSDNFLKLLSMNKLENTLQIDFWKKRPYIIRMVLSAVEWPPSVHHLGTHFLYITGLDSQRPLESKKQEPTKKTVTEKQNSIESVDRVQFAVHFNKSPFQ